PAPSLLQCDACQTVLGGEVVNTPAPVACPSCGTSLQIEVFPAFFRPAPPAAPVAAPLLTAEDAGCFFHPAKKAAVPCGHCGRFLCATCDLELAPGRHLCPDCVDKTLAPTTTGDHGNPLRRELETERVFFDKLSFFLVAAPLAIFPLAGLTMFTAPAALVLAAAAWRQPARSLVPRSRAWLLWAIVLAALCLAGWVAFWYYFASTLWPIILHAGEVQSRRRSF
ncbi:MAG: hypothetical protein JO117_09710, partial [Verrucomicrobia bacterium]|nr:hypothetical protein [Verrucomicrobiota bacterium]